MLIERPALVGALSASAPCRRALALAALVAAGALAGAGCHTDEEDIRADVEVLVVNEGESAVAAAERLARRGVRAIPSVEARLHTAPDGGRKNLILALRRIGHADAVPLLRHVALHDAARDVRREAEWTLELWAASRDERGDRARAALVDIDARRGRQEAG